MQFSTISSWAVVIARALDTYHCDSRALFERAGLDPQRMRDPNARYAVFGMTRLWNLAVRETRDPAFGLAVAKYWHPTTFHALGYAWMASETLEDAFERTARYIRIVTNAAHASLVEREAGFRFSLSPVSGGLVPANEAVDAALATLVTMCRTSYGPEFRVQRVEMSRPLPVDPKPFSEYFQSPIEYGAPLNALHMDKASARARLPTANAELAVANDRIMKEHLARLDRDSVATQVKARLLGRLSSGHATEESVAQALNMSLRSLQRRLKEEGASYKDLLNETRRELATQYVKNSRLSIGEITYLLGFSEPSNFTRAFRRWQGVSPSEFRGQV
jgi:AraC-like DNA-binding protein